MSIAEREAKIRQLLATRAITVDERREQRVSFAYGNLKIEEPRITRSMVETVIGKP